MRLLSIACLIMQLSSSSGFAELTFQLLPAFVLTGEGMGLSLGKDGSFYAYQGDYIVRLTPDGVVTRVSAAFTPSVGQLVQTDDGALYGVEGYNSGGVFRVDGSGVGEILFHFNGTNGLPYGYGPKVGLVQTRDGRLFGSTYYTGITGGPGTLYQVQINGDFVGVLSYMFDGTNGWGPASRPLLASDSNLYGTTTYGGQGGNGVIFRVTPSGDVSTLYSFSGADGSPPYAGLAQGSDGSLYGSTASGGAGYGTIFRVNTNGAFARLLAFSGTNGAHPLGEMVEGPDGNLYGTTSAGGGHSGGTIFRLTTNGTLTTIVSLSSATGTSPQSALVLGSDGNIYGTTAGVSGIGNVFRLVPPPDITSASLTSGNMNLTWSSFSNGIYRIDYATNLPNTNWLTLASGITATSTLSSFTDFSPTDSSRFYRVVLLP